MWIKSVHLKTCDSRHQVRRINWN